jgi:hypothetical protein
LVAVTDPALDADRLGDVGWWVAAAFIACVGFLALVPTAARGTHKLLAAAGLTLVLVAVFVSLVPTATRQGWGRWLLIRAATRAAAAGLLMAYMLWQVRWLL